MPPPLSCLRFTGYPTEGPLGEDPGKERKPRVSWNFEIRRISNLSILKCDVVGCPMGAMMKYAQFSRGGVDVSLNTARSVVGNVKNLNQIGRYDLTMVLL